jgi:drug/metabolite transporter (DMT)-like permease
MSDVAGHASPSRLALGCHGLLAWAEQRVSSGQAALVMTAIPLWIVVLSAAISRRRPSTPVLAGLALGIAGVAVLTRGGVWTGRPIDVAVLVIGTFTWAAGSLVGKHGAHSASVAHMTAMQLTAGAAWLLIASAATGELASWTPAQLTARSVMALAFLIVCGTVLGFGAYNWLLRVTTPAAASSYAFVNPIVALALGWAVGDGIITGRTVIAAVLVLLALALTRARPSRQRAVARVDQLERAPQR